MENTKIHFNFFTAFKFIFIISSLCAFIGFTILFKNVDLLKLIIYESIYFPTNLLILSYLFTLFPIGTVTIEGFKTRNGIGLLREIKWNQACPVNF